MFKSYNKSDLCSQAFAIFWRCEYSHLLKNNTISTLIIKNWRNWVGCLSMPSSEYEEVAWLVAHLPSSVHDWSADVGEVSWLFANLQSYVHDWSADVGEVTWLVAHLPSSGHDWSADDEEVAWLVAHLPSYVHDWSADDWEVTWLVAHLLSYVHDWSASAAVHSAQKKKASAMETKMAFI